ncbi:Transcription factor [Quillaja saponaria]|uniref:Transcription factor n=1 Tax=Quillaja saponaria TaxID=32244 RepID=A0AAD7PFH0_QUISA|nr:Transcription factor [Quillaja saponaria]
MGCSGFCKGYSKVKYMRRRWRRTTVRGGGCHRVKVQMKMRKLQRLIPGGNGLNPDRLFLRTAEHILHLRFQLNVLQALSDIYN